MRLKEKNFSAIDKYVLKYLNKFMKLFCRLLIISTSIALFFVSVTSVIAFSPKDTFDWNYLQDSQQVLGVSIGAQSTLPGDSSEQKIPTVCEDPSENYLFKFDTNVTPDNPLYFIKKFDETAKLALTPDQSKREEVRLCYAKQRLVELEKLTAANKNQNIAGMAASYNDFISKVAKGLEELKSQGKDVTALSALLDAEAAKHKLFLQELKLKLPAAAEKGIDTAVMASERASDTVADVSGKPPVPQEVIARLQALKIQGLLTGEEVQTLIAANTRKEARERMRKYVDANLIPEADFIKMDEAAKTFFPQDFIRAMEMEKFRELHELETQKPDAGTLNKLQEFAKNYKPGDQIPSDLKRWWVPMVRLEDLQKTTRVDLIDSDLFKNRPEDQQKFKEMVERFKPKQDDVDYINRMVKGNANVLNDPSFARIKAIADKFGTVESNVARTVPTQFCSTETHWVSIPFMPGGGYCVPNYEFPGIDTKESRAINSCPPGYHRNSSESPCFPNNPSGGFGSDLPPAGDCPSGYKWKEEKSSPRGGYCSIEFASIGGGFPSPIAIPAYCPSGKMFVDGKCQTYNPVPGDGCREGYWNGQKCVVPKDCGPGKYQDYNGECKSSEEQYQNYLNKCKDKPTPPGGCGDGYWDMESCSCKKGTYPSPTGGYNPEEMCKRAPNCRWTGNSCECSSGGGSGSGGGGSQEEACRRGTNCTWKGNYCECIPSGGATNTTTQSSGGSSSCGSGYSWNGSYCAPRTTSDQSPTTTSYPSTSQPTSYPQPTSAPQQPTESQSTPPPSTPPPSTPPPSTPPPTMPSP